MALLHGDALSEGREFRRCRNTLDPPRRLERLHGLERGTSKRQLRVGTVVCVHVLVARSAQCHQVGIQLSTHPPIRKVMHLEVGSGAAGPTRLLSAQVARATRRPMRRRDVLVVSDQIVQCPFCSSARSLGWRGSDRRASMSASQGPLDKNGRGPLVWRGPTSPDRKSLQPRGALNTPSIPAFVPRVYDHPPRDEFLRYGGH